MNTSRFVHSTSGSCFLLPEEMILRRAATEQKDSVKGVATVMPAGRSLRIRDQVIFWLLGVFAIGTGSLLWKMDSEGQWLVRGVSLASVAVGLLFWGILMHCLWVNGRPSHRSAGSQAEGFWFYSGGSVHLGPVIGALKQFADEVQARSVILLESQAARWHFKAGYQASPGLGRAVAHALHQRIPKAGQTACCIEVLDAAVMAFSTPLSIMSGQDYALVALFEASPLPRHGSIAPAARRSAAWIRDYLERVEESSACRAQGLSAGPGALSPSLPVCCSVCDQVRLVKGGVEHWTHWSQWLHQAHELPLTHTICPSCAGWLYGVSAHPEPDAKNHHHVV
jgi:hypothetical protein